MGEKALTALGLVEELPLKINARLQKLATKTLAPSLEVAALIEIGELTQQLAETELLLNKMDVR